jgi:hypothetical protein
MQQARRTIPRDLCQPGQKNRVSLIDSHSLPDEIIATIRSMTPPYNYFFSIEESYCQAVVPTLDDQTGEMIHSDKEEAPVYTLTIRQDDVEKGVTLGQQLEKMAQRENEKMVYLYLLDTFSYLLRSIQLLKDTGLLITELSDHTMTFQTVANVILISLYGNAQVKTELSQPPKETDMKKQKNSDISKGHLWERTLFSMIYNEPTTADKIQEGLKDFLGGSPHSLFLSNQMNDVKEKINEYYSKRFEITENQTQPDYASWKTKCLETLPLWDTFELVIYFFDFVDKHKELLPSYRQPFFNLCKEFFVATMSDTRMDIPTLQKRVQNEMVKVRLL